MTMRERIARALWTELPDCTRYDDLHPNIRATYLKRADAVLAAMREPTEAMIDAGASTRKLTVYSTWRVMIDAAVSGGQVGV